MVATANHPNRSRVRKTAKAAALETSVLTPEHADHDKDYAALLDSVQRQFRSVVDAGHTLFCTETSVDLFDTYLNALGMDRQIHNCATCKGFINKHGGLVYVTDYGVTQSALWPMVSAPTFYARAAADLRFTTGYRTRITKPFYTKRTMLGLVEDGQERRAKLCRCVAPLGGYGCAGLSRSNY